MVSAITTETEPIAATTLGINYARLFDYFASRYLEATDANKDEPALYYAELQECTITLAEAYEAIYAYETGDIGRVYNTYDFTSELDNPANTLDVSGFKPAGPNGQLTWQ